MIDEHLDVDQASAYTGYSKSWLYELRRQGRGPTSWLDHHKLVYPRSGLDLFLARCRQRSTRGETE